MYGLESLPKGGILPQPRNAVSKIRANHAGIARSPLFPDADYNPVLFDRAASLNFPRPPASRRTWRKTIPRLAVLSATLLIAHAASAEPGRSQAELEQLGRSIGELQQQLISERTREKSITGELDELERQLAALVRERRTKMAGLHQVQHSKTELERQRHELEKKHRESRHHLTRLIRASYMLGRQSGLKLILNQQNPAATTRSLSIFRYLSTARNRRILEAKKLRRELLTTRVELDRRHQELGEFLELLARNQTQLDTKRARRERSLAAIREQMRENREQMVLYKQRERTLERLLVRLRRHSIQQPAPPPDPGDEPAQPAATNASRRTQSAPRLPTEAITLGGFKQYKGNMGAPVRGRVTARFGQRKPESGLRWEGLMFEAAEGEEVVAIYPGQVVFSDWFRGYGQLMVLDHGGGYMSLYGHNRLLRADLGASVKAGQGIGEAGSTGGLIRPGLYFEIRHNGEPRDPLKWCRI